MYTWYEYLIIVILSICTLYLYLMVFILGRCPVQLYMRIRKCECYSRGGYGMVAHTTIHGKTACVLRRYGLGRWEHCPWRARPCGKTTSPQNVLGERGKPLFMLGWNGLLFHINLTQVSVALAARTRNEPPERKACTPRCLHRNPPSDF